MGNTLSGAEIDCLLHSGLETNTSGINTSNERDIMGATHCFDCEYWTAQTCRSPMRVERKIDELKQVWEMMEGAIHEKGEKYKEVTYYLNDIMRDVKENGAPLPECKFNHNCFKAKVNA